MLSVALLFSFFYIIQASYWNPWEGDLVKSFERGVQTSGSTYIIKQNEFYHAAYVGYFKFNTLDITKKYSLMRLQISSKSYTFLHLYTNGAYPRLKIIIDDKNYDYEYQIGPLLIINQWFQLGIGYKQSVKTSYLIWQYVPYSLIYQYPVAYPNAIDPSILELELCIACQPYEYLYTKFDGSYSSVKMITQNEVIHGLNKIYYNQHEMTTSLLRESFNPTANVLAYAQSQYVPNLAIGCLTATKFFYDGVCMEKTQCPNLIYYQKTQFGNQNSVFWNTITNTCDTCVDNCLLCDSNAICQQCNFGFYLDSGSNKCKQCSTGSFYNPLNQLCVPTCPAGYQSDPINQICVLNFNPFYQLFNPILLPRNFNQNNGFVLKDSSDNSIKSDQFSQCYLDNNSFGPYTFLGGQGALNSYYLNKKILGLPKNFKKTIFFQAIIYNNGQQGDFSLKINNNLITLASFNKLFTNQYLCTDNQLVSMYELSYIINDSSTDLDINIFTNKNGWGIRNFSMNITKCHSTCLDCTSDGNPWSCTSCQMQATSIQVNNNCACKIGQYTQFQNCFSPPCYVCADCPPNCVSCEDQTGKCTNCANGYSVQNGVCNLNNICTDLYTTDPGSSYCIRQKDFALSQFINDRISSNIDFWDYTASGPPTTSCYTRLFAPYLFGLQKVVFNYKLQNYQLFHYQVEINLSATNIDLMAVADYMNYYINSNLIKKANYRTLSTTSYCYIAAQGEQLVKETLSYNTKSNQLTFLIESHLTASYYYTFNDVYINYVRCHASCSNCNDGNSCSACIANASQDATKGNFCYCNDGYYFTYDWANSSGLCLKCNPFCKTCNGPNISDCLTCQESYKVVNNICVNACNTNQFWDWTLHKCVDCSDCCASCTGTANNQCTSCYTGYMTLSSPVCKFQTDNSTCNSCDTNVTNSLCGGTLTNHNYCLTKGWVSYNTNTCVFCYTADLSGNCGGSSQYNSVCNQAGYFYSSVTGTCLSCAQAIVTDCGDPSIRTQCVSNKWIYESLSNCINCLITSNPLCCHSTCNTCNGQYEDNCLTCYGSQILFNGFCLDKCPNGYKLNPLTNTCSKCTVFIGVPECNNCAADCRTCAAANINNCKTCNGSNVIDYTTNRCVCQDSEDTRTFFYECSFNNQAVLEIKLLNSGPKMTIDFGKILLDLPSLTPQEMSNNVCKAIFDSTNLSLIGANALCQIQFNMINIELDESATIMDGDLLNFLPNVLKFKINSTSYIDTFLNNVASQEPPSNTAVVFVYNNIENTCNDYKIILDKILNDSKRGFKSVTWTLLNPTTNSEDIQIQQILSKASSQNQGSIIIPKGIIPINVQKNIKVQYLFKNTFKGSQQFLFEVKTFKNIISQIQSDIKIPYYRFQEFIVSLTYIIQYCDAKGDQLNTNDPVDISITSPQSPLINTQLKNSQQTEVTFTVNKFTYASNQNNQIDALITISNDPTITSSQQLAFKTEPSSLIVKIEGGNRKIDYKSKLTLTSKVRDLDIEDENANQGIALNWVCSDPSDFTKPCLDQNGLPFVINQSKPEIPPNTFSPYVVIKIQLKGDKDVRSTTDLIVVLFIEFDLPLLDVQLSLIDPFAQTINLNEEIFTTLNYDTTVNPDILSFSSTIVYQNIVVGAIKFDYTKLKFKLWDTFGKFTRTDPSVTIRFSVFNPYYFMPSISIVSFKINFPPEKCQFSISPIPNASNPVYGLSTLFTLSVQDCIDDNLPLSYQFFLYRSKGDLDYEILNPQQVKRRQLNNQSPDTNLLTILPAGNLIIMAVVSDSLQAVYNATIPVAVTNQNMASSQYISYIDNALLLTGKTNDQIISELSLISEDLSLRADLTPDAQINSRKIKIVDTLKSASLSLSTFSTFSTVSDKSISSLMQSGITLDSTQETAQLNNLVNSLAEDWTITPYEQLSDVKKTLRNQQMYDYFDIIDKLAANSKLQDTNIYSLQVDISTKIGDKMNYNSLPNEEPKNFVGKSLTIQTQKVTEKNLCRYLFCTNFQPQDNQQGVIPIFNVAYKTHQENPFINDPSYKNYTTYLLNSTGNKKPTQFPVINPSIIASPKPSDNSPINTKDLQYPFQGKEKEGLSCFLKTEGSWTKSGCKLVYSQKSQQYTCICQALGPTTIVDDLEALVNNKNLQTAFGSQGIENLSKFTNFYMFIAFWTLVGKTIGFILLYLKGKQLDQQYQKSYQFSSSNVYLNKVYPAIDIQSINQASSNIIQKQESADTPNDKISKQNTTLMRKPRKKFLNSFNGLKAQPSSFFQMNMNNNQLNKQQTNDNTSIKLDQVDNNNKNENDNNIDIQLKNQEVKSVLETEQYLQQDDNANTPNTYNEKNDYLSKNNLKNNEIDMNDLQVKKQADSPGINNTQVDSFINMNKTSKKPITDLTETEYSEKTKKFMKLNPLKQTIYFHNFFGVFLIFDSQMPRPLRFSCFYVRMIHSFAVSIVFDQTYSFVQLVALSIANSILIMVFLKLLEIVTKKVGKYAIGITLMLLLGFYYYVILSIVSGQEPYRSNQSMMTYLLFTCLDLFFISFFSAIIQRFFAISTIKKQKLQSCSQKIFELLHLQLILKSIF